MKITRILLAILFSMTMLCTITEARYYDPIEGRFISKDPIGFQSGDVNPYGYVFNNPTNLTDPDGLSPVSKLVQLSKKYWGKVMTANKNTCKEARVKIYKDKEGKNYSDIKVFADGTVKPANANLPKDVIDKAVQLLQGFIVFAGDFADPFGASEAE